MRCLYSKVRGPYKHNDKSLPWRVRALNSVTHTWEDKYFQTKDDAKTCREHIEDEIESQAIEDREKLLSRLPRLENYENSIDYHKDVIDSVSNFILKRMGANSDVVRSDARVLKELAMTAIDLSQTVNIEEKLAQLEKLVAKS